MNSFNQFSKINPATTKAIKRKYVDTVPKSWVFEAFDSSTHPKESLRSFATKYDISDQTASNWLRSVKFKYLLSIKKPEALKAP